MEKTKSKAKDNSDKKCMRCGWGESDGKIIQTIESGISRDGRYIVHVFCDDCLQVLLEV